MASEVIEEGGGGLDLNYQRPSPIPTPTKLVFNVTPEVDLQTQINLFYLMYEIFHYLILK